MFQCRNNCVAGNPNASKLEVLTGRSLLEECRQNQHTIMLANLHIEGAQKSLPQFCGAAATEPNWMKFGTGPLYHPSRMQNFTALIFSTAEKWYTKCLRSSKKAKLDKN